MHKQILNTFFIVIALFCYILCFISCNQTNTTNNTLAPYSKVKKEHQTELMSLNKDLVNLDKEMISKFIERRKWNMQISETGLYYQIYHHTNENYASNEKIAIINYTISMLDGNILYSSTEDGQRSINIGNNQEELGLREGLLKMRLGEKARFIMPPHLAFGVAGDGNKVPYYTILVYDIELIELKDIIKD